MNKLDMSKEREAFESWAAEANMSLRQHYNCDEYCSNETVAAWNAWKHRAQLDSREWVSVEELEKSQKSCWCWIVYKGRVTAAYYMGRFYFNNTSSDCFMTECISAVMPWVKPQPPKETK